MKACCCYVTYGYICSCSNRNLTQLDTIKMVSVILQIQRTSTQIFSKGHSPTLDCFILTLELMSSFHTNFVDFSSFASDLTKPTSLFLMKIKNKGAGFLFLKKSFYIKIFHLFRCVLKKSKIIHLDKDPSEKILCTKCILTVLYQLHFFKGILQTIVLNFDSKF